MLHLLYGVMCVLSVTMLPSASAANYEKCKWPNENCEKNEDCCSAICHKEHEGADPRCSDSPLSYPCFASFQCETGLACGDSYSCCSPFWGVCKNKTDCCDQALNCREEEGFTYRRCLPGGGERLGVSRTLLIGVFLVWGFVAMQRTRHCGAVV